MRAGESLESGWIEILTSFYKHPVEIIANSLLSSTIVYPLLGCSVGAAAWYTVLTALAEFFYHWEHPHAALARLPRPAARVAPHPP